MYWSNPILSAPSRYFASVLSRPQRRLFTSSCATRPPAACAGEATLELVTRTGGASPNAAPPPVAVTPPDPTRPMSLHVACKAGRVDDVRACLDGGEDVEGTDALGWAPLHLACDSGHVAVARLCLDRGAAIDRVIQDGRTPLYISCDSGHVAAAQLCIERGADVHISDHTGLTPLHITCVFGRADVSRMLFDRGADVGRTDFEGWTPLLVASLNGHTSTARQCLERGADINWANHNGDTALEVARGEGRVVMAAWLAQIQQRGSWASYLSEPRYALVVLRALVARGRARRRRADSGKEQLLDFLFPGDQPRRRARRHQPRLPDDLFSVIAQYYFGGGLSAADEATAAAEAAPTEVPESEIHSVWPDEAHDYDY